MDARERLRQAIDRQQGRLRAGVPGDRAGAILALLRARERLPHHRGIDPPPDPVTGRRLADPGGNKALQLCVESTGGEAAPATDEAGAGLDGWGERFLRECGELAEAELVLAHCETGFMRVVEDGDGGSTPGSRRSRR